MIENSLEVVSLFNNKNIVWGTNCYECHNEVFLLQDKYHPWNKSDVNLEVICQNCKTPIIINQDMASEFYTNKILDLFKDISGSIIDVGCGGGLLSNYFHSKNNLVSAIDIDKECEKELVDGINFILDSAENIKNHFPNNAVDYIIGRDILMFINNIEEFILNCYQIAKKGIIFVGWYDLDHDKMVNKTNPFDFFKLIPKDSFIIEELDWYKNGYVISITRKYQLQ